MSGTLVSRPTAVPKIINRYSSQPRSTSAFDTDLTRSIPISSLLGPATQVQPEEKTTIHGREYYRRWFETYPYPCDEPEKDRLDAFHHAFYRVALDDRLHESILPRGKKRVLDLGSGTGIWAIEMAAKYPDSEIIAIDIGDAHPQIAGVDFGVDWRSGIDFNKADWGVPKNYFDLVHMGCLCGAVPDWGELFRKVERHLKPGGQLESVEFDWTPRRDESRPIHPDSPVLRFWQLLQHATQRIGKPIAYRADMQTLLVGAGFDIVKHSTVTIATAENLRSFDDDHPYNELARMYQFTMFGHSLLDIDIASVENDEAKLRRYLDMDKSSFDGIQSISMALFTQHLGHSLASFQKLCRDFQKTVRRRDSPFYHFL